MSGENSRQRVALIAPGMNLKRSTLFRSVILMEPLKDIDVRKIIKPQQRIGEFIKNLNPGFLFALYDLADRHEMKSL